MRLGIGPPVIGYSSLRADAYFSAEMGADEPGTGTITRLLPSIRRANGTNTDAMTTHGGQSGIELQTRSSLCLGELCDRRSDGEETT